jgi:hypothetical protein
LDKALEFLRTELNWSLPDLIRTLCEQNDPKNRQRQTGYMKTAYGREVIDLCLSHPRSTELELRKMLLDSVDWGIPEYRQEIVELGKQTGFGEYTMSITRIDSLHGLLDTANEHALRFIELLDSVTCETRRTSEMTSLTSRHIIILAILCYSQSNRHNNVQTLLALHLHSNGVRRRVIELLAKYGLSVSYSTIQRVLKSLSDQAIASVATAGRSQNSVTVYDNFEQMEGVRDE